MHYIPKQSQEFKWSLTSYSSIFSKVISEEPYRRLLWMHQTARNTSFKRHPHPKSARFFWSHCYFLKKLNETTTYLAVKPAQLQISSVSTRTKLYFYCSFSSCVLDYEPFSVPSLRGLCGYNKLGVPSPLFCLSIKHNTSLHLSLRSSTVIEPTNAV